MGWMLCETLTNILTATGNALIQKNRFDFKVYNHFRGYKSGHEKLWSISDWVFDQ